MICRGGARKVEESLPFGRRERKKGIPKHLLALLVEPVLCPIYMREWLAFSWVLIGG